MYFSIILFFKLFSYVYDHDEEKKKILIIEKVSKIYDTVQNDNLIDKVSKFVKTFYFW